MTPLKYSSGLIFILSAPSGTGKTTVAQKILKTMTGIVPSVSLNTRPKRSKEKEGIDYIFVSEEEFEYNIKIGNLIEYTEIYNTKRGTPKAPLLQNQQKGIDTLCVIEWEGMKNLKKQLGASNIVSIFLLPPSLQILRERLVLRKQDTLKEIENRLKQAEKEIKYAIDYDYIVINDDLASCAQIVSNIIVAERHKTFRVMKTIDI